MDTLSGAGGLDGHTVWSRQTHHGGYLQGDGKWTSPQSGRLDKTTTISIIIRNNKHQLSISNTVMRYAFIALTACVAGGAAAYLLYSKHYLKPARPACADAGRVEEEDGEIDEELVAAFQANELNII